MPATRISLSVVAQARRREQFFTILAVARHCHELLSPYLDDGTILFEPSAGSNAFGITAPAGQQVIGMDILPAHGDVLKRDFFRTNLGKLLDPCDRMLPRACIGNFPFSSAHRFLNRALKTTGLVGFIAPMSARKPRWQARVMTQARLLIDEPLPLRSFTLAGTEAILRTTFQVWTTEKRRGPNLRLRSQLDRTHPHFHMECYNGSGDQAILYRDWNLAVSRNGGGSYVPVEAGGELAPNRQWYLFWTRSERCLDRLRRIDYRGLSKDYTSQQGFNMGDVVRAYNKLARQERCRSSETGI